MTKPEAIMYLFSQAHIYLLLLDGHIVASSLQKQDTQKLQEAKKYCCLSLKKDSEHLMALNSKLSLSRFINSCHTKNDY